MRSPGSPQRRSFAALIVMASLLTACGNSSNPTAAMTPGGPVTPPPSNVAKCAGGEVDPQRLFLQQVGADRAIIKWRGNKAGGAEAMSLCFGTDRTALPLASQKTATVTQTDHREVLLTGLTPDTLYFYSIGGAGSALATRSFRTAPALGAAPSDGNVRLWVLGDSGTAGSSLDATGGMAASVRDGYLKWVANNGREPTDMVLMLGDAAYLDGTDAQFQSAVFDTYPEILSAAAMWPTIGNHEMGSSGVSIAPATALYLPGTGGLGDALPDSPMPYLNIHTLPTLGENGGEPSNTEQYYAFDYGNVHVVSLDSQVAIRDAGNNETMKQWLINDLSANNSDWTVVIFHHPPYTKGSHDSDSTAGGVDQPIFDIREQYTEIFEDHGVDVVYSGHSHSYERSFYLKGHTGLEATFDPAVHAENSAGVPLTGRGTQAYRQISPNSGADDKVVYTVAGSSGQATTTAESYPHDAMAHSEILLGSVVIDASKTKLTATFVNVDGEVLDDFVIQR
ncbi:MAG: metallophosphoesterase family protein [Pseudomonadota bacterium]